METNKIKTGDLKVMFGKFKGKKYGEVDTGYLKWLNEKGFWDDSTRYSVNAEIKAYAEKRILIGEL